MRTLTLSALAAFGLALSMPAQAATNIVANGDFSAGTNGFVVAPGTEITTSTGSVYASCCNVSNIDVNNPFAVFGGGSEANVSTLSQALTTEIGQIYTLSYKSTALGGGSTGFQAQVLNGLVPIATNVTTAVAGAPYVTYLLNFIAQSTSTTISFSVSPAGSGAGDGIDPILDDVSVVAAPEPATWLMMILGFGLVGSQLRRRKRHGLAVA